MDNTIFGSGNVHELVDLIFGPDLEIENTNNDDLDEQIKQDILLHNYINSLNTWTTKPQNQSLH